MIKTRLCDLLDIKYPIIQAAMAWVTDAELVAAVSNAGGMGTLGPNAGVTTITRDPLAVGERLRSQIRKTRELTDRPFAVNILVPGPDETAFSEQTVKAVIEEKVPVAIVSQGGPKVYTERLKKAGIKVLHVISTVRHARKAEEAGVDAVITSGTEGGGHSGFDQITTFTLVPQVADAIKIPVIAGGGVGDCRGLVAALALGAEGVYMGTRFIATRECPAHINFKQALLKAEETDTVVIRHGRPLFEQATDVHTELRLGTVRILFNEFSGQLLKRQTEGKSPEEIMEFYVSTPPEYKDEEVSRAMVASVHGDVTQGLVAGGQAVGLIRDVPTCQELVERIINESNEIYDRLGAVFQR